MVNMLRISSSLVSTKSSNNYIDFIADSFLVNAHMKIYIWFFYTLAFLITMILMRRCSPERK